MTLPETIHTQSGTSPLIEVLALYICAEKGQPMQSVKEVNAIAGIGLDGDRYATRTGDFSGTKRLPDEDRQVTFISRPGIDTANASLTDPEDVPFTENETRRNIVINISAQELNDLKDKQFVVQSILFEGVELCDPCDLPKNLRKKKGDFKKAFEGKGGLRARILSSGKLTVKS